MSLNPAPYTTCPPVESRDRRVVDLTSAGFPEIPALGMSRTSCATEGSVFHRHRQCMEITLCVRGSVKFDCGGKAYTLMPGAVFASQTEDVHRLRMNPRGARLCWLFFRMPRRGETALGLSAGETAFLVRRLRGLPHKAFAVADDVRQAFLDLFAAYDLRDEAAAGRTLLLRTALLRLLTALVAPGGEADGRGHEPVFSALVDRIRRHPERDYGVDRLVAETKLSPNTILSRFRRLTGLPPQAFVMKCRIRRAMDMLAKGGAESVTDIAAALGFSSSQHFATRFRQETGLSPKAWREQRRMP